MVSVPRDLAVPRPIDLPATVPLDPDADLTILDDAKILAAPEDPASWPAWRVALSRWRCEAYRRQRYDGASYRRGAGWPASCRAVQLVWLWDERLYDRHAGRFLVEEFIDAGDREYGGFDAVVLWHAYPVIGVDPRNQWDFYRDVPALADVVARFQARGLRVFVDYNPWDIGTRRRPEDDYTELARLVIDYQVDGVFLDTLKQGAPELVQALQTVGRPIALEGESRLPLTAIADHSLSWAQWFADSPAPGVLRAHCFERRHMMHHTRRWNRDHSGEMQSAWVNGCGVLVWDDVFGVWVGWNARDRSTLRAMRRVQIAFSRHFLDGVWTPLADLHRHAIAAGVFAHRYDLDGISLWTVINRSVTDYEGYVLDVGDTDGEWIEYTADAEVRTSPTAVATAVPARGIACLIRVTAGATMPATRGEPVRPDPDTTFPRRAIRQITDSTSRARPHRSADPASVVVTAGPRQLMVTYRRRETGQRDEAPWVDAWKPLPPDLHDIVREERTVHLAPVAVDRLEVSNAQYQQFINATGYSPEVAHRFLAHWIDGAPAPDQADHAVTFVSLEDARTFAAWRGSRLPTNAEWQVALTEAGAAHRSPRVWNWTESEFTDGITRSVLLKGGSWFSATGSDWYVDGGEQPPEWELKLILPGGGLERSECVGFRCATDLDE